MSSWDSKLPQRSQVPGHYVLFLLGKMRHETEKPGRVSLRRMPSEKPGLGDVSVAATSLHEQAKMRHTLLLRTGNPGSPTQHWWLQPAAQLGGMPPHFSSIMCSSEDLQIPWLREGSERPQLSLKYPHPLLCSHAEPHPLEKRYHGSELALRQHGHTAGGS